MSGWVAVHRSLVDNPFWKAEKFTYGQAWVDLILTANFTDGSFMKSGQIVKVKRGQCAMSYASYQKRWGWSKGRVQRFFSNLESERMVSIQASHLTTIVTICNYDKFQDLKKADEPTKRPANEPSVDTPDGSSGGSRYNKVNNNQQGEQEKTTPAKADFSAFDNAVTQWNEFANEVGLPKVSKITTPRARKIDTAYKNYKKLRTELNDGNPEPKRMLEKVEFVEALIMVTRKQITDFHINMPITFDYLLDKKRVDTITETGVFK